MSIVLVDYDPSWPAAFESARADLLEALRGIEFRGLEHIGSTAVPGLGGKPMVDMVMCVDDMSTADRIAPRLEPLGYVGWHSTPTRRTFERRNAEGTATAHLHVVRVDSKEWTDQILVRDWLRSNPEDRDAYAALKRELAARYDDTRDYSAAKTDFILGLLAKASAA